MSTETDRTSSSTETAQGNSWGGYTYPKREEPTDLGAGDPEAAAVVESDTEAESANEGEAETASETGSEAAVETEAEPEAEGEIVEEAEIVDETDDQDGETDTDIEAQDTEEDPQETTEAPVALHTGADPLLTAEAESDLLSRWTTIQMSFVEDPLGAVQDADALIAEISATLVASIEARKSDLAGGWQSEHPDTEELRLALREYRSFIGVILPT